MKRSLTMWGCALTALSLALTGCGSQEIRPEQGVTARLDAENGHVVMPVDAYSTSESDEAVMTQARLAILRHCLQKSGHNGVKPPPSAAQRPVEERPYGLWIVARAKVHGFDLPPGDETAEPTPPPGGWSDESDPAFQAAYDVCAAEVMDQMIAVSSPATSPQSTSVIMDVTARAHGLAAKDPAWETARSEWKECLRQNGLTPSAGQDAFVSTEAEHVSATPESQGQNATVKREEIRIATIEASCNEQTNLTQRLGDIEAGYQAALIKPHEAALVEEQQDNAKHLDAARAYLASHQ